jgi:hypothetical protein
MLNSRPQAFFDGDAMASEETRQRAAAPADTSLVQYRNDFFQREVRLLAVKGENLLQYFSNGEVLPPRGIGSQVPSSQKRCIQRIAELALTWNCSAASRRDPPAATNSITRILKSPGYGPRIGQPSGESMR